MSRENDVFEMRSRKRGASEWAEGLPGTSPSSSCGHRQAWDVSAARVHGRVYLIIGPRTDLWTLNRGNMHHTESFTLFPFKGFYAEPRRRQWYPTPVLLPGKSHGRRSLVGCSPWGREESDVTEWLHFHFSLLCIGEGNGNPLQCSCLENPRDGVT